MQIWSVGWKSGTRAPLCAESTLRGPLTSSTSMYILYVLLRRSLIGYPVMPGKWGSAVIAEPRRYLHFTRELWCVGIHRRYYRRHHTVGTVSRWCGLILPDLFLMSWDWLVPREGRAGSGMLAGMLCPRASYSSSSNLLCKCWRLKTNVP